VNDFGHFGWRPTSTQADGILASMSALSERYTHTGRPSIPPEKTAGRT